jgi:hypothetical protein
LTSPGNGTAKPLLLVVIATSAPLAALSTTAQSGKAGELFGRIAEEAKPDGNVS